MYAVLHRQLLCWARMRKRRRKRRQFTAARLCDSPVLLDYMATVTVDIYGTASATAGIGIDAADTSTDISAPGGGLRDLAAELQTLLGLRVGRRCSIFQTPARPAEREQLTAVRQDLHRVGLGGGGGWRRVQVGGVAFFLLAFG